MASIKETCAIVGIGETPYIRGCDKSVIELHLEASLKALDDAGLSPKDIDGVMPSSVAGTFAEQFILNLGIE
ncbi:MAG: transporter, partial [Dehalococcoidia bacterium]